MPRACRHRRLHLLRLLMLVLVGLGTFGTSLASALTDLHMLGHADIRGDVHGHDDAALEVPPADEDSANALLHALVHSVDCHGHGNMLPLAAAAWVLPLPPSPPRPVTMTPQWPAQPAKSLFRPPIAS